ncbi:hypothetical protein DWW24_21890 [Odoribacter splanchnicus]|uniref:WG repeat-containing protein n=2 Tax=Odoribacter splanchnicus TaxID=28118 RepID=A0A412VZB5_9BACT|nr:hypothetical protein DWW24_21890 [Odoribacter splanchnicus]
MFILVILGYQAFPDNVKEILARVPYSQLPFACTKEASYPNPAIGYPFDMNTGFSLDCYNDLGLTQMYADPNMNCVVFRKFNPQKGNFDLIALDIEVSEWGKKILATYHEGELVDYIEGEVYWYSDGMILIKQWQINPEHKVIVTLLKVESAVPVSAFSKFNSVKAQRIDTYYEITADGKFREEKQVKYRPKTYTRSYLTDKTQNLWEGNEALME